MADFLLEVTTTTRKVAVGATASGSASGAGSATRTRGRVDSEGSVGRRRRNSYHFCLPSGIFCGMSADPAKEPQGCAARGLLTHCSASGY